MRSMLTGTISRNWYRMGARSTTSRMRNSDPTGPSTTWYSRESSAHDGSGTAESLFASETAAALVIAALEVSAAEEVEEEGLDDEEDLD